MIFRILKKRWWQFTLIAAISGLALDRIYYALPVEQQTDAVSYALIASYMLGIIVYAVWQFVAHKRPGNLTVYKITKDSEEYAEYEEITPL